MILACGDALIDFVTRHHQGRDMFEPFGGGSVLNFAVALGRLDADVGFVGGVSSDMFGDTILDHLAASNVRTELASRLDAPSTLAFARLENGHSRYAFFDENSAMRRWRFDASLFAGLMPDAVHVGSIALIDPQACAHHRALIEHFAKSSVISIDPNCRPGLVTDHQDYRRRIGSLCDLCDIVKLSDEDLAYLAPDVSHEDFVAARLRAGAKLVALTCGAKGAVLATQHHRVEIKGADCKLRDTIGAGDSFHGALMAALLRMNALSKSGLAELDANTLKRVGDFAAAAAALTCSRDGANPPWRREMGEL